MKTLPGFLAIFLLSAGLAAAQDLNGLSLATNHSAGQGDITGYRYYYEPGFNPATAKAPPNPKKIVKPEVGGIFVDGAKYGWNIISPAAPITWGNGEKYMTAPDPMKDLLNESGPASHRQSGGFKLFTIEF